jgi:myo-inositol-1(or 4)-monophosphatase
MEQLPPDAQTMEELEHTAREAALHAGDLLARRFGDHTSLTIRDKSRFDYVTDVDHESEDIIVSAIRRRFPDHEILAEERPTSTRGAGFLWIVDPLDGTTNFIHGFPFVAVAIGVMYAGNMVLGLTYDPLRRELFTTRRGGGAWRNGQPLRVRPGASLKAALVATGFPFRHKQVVEAYLRSFQNIFLEVSGIRRAGSAALDLAYVACGRVDGFWEIGLGPWDIASGSLLVEEAGGRVSDFAGGDDFLGSGHIVAGTPVVHPFLLREVQQHLAPVLGLVQPGHARICSGVSSP